MSDEGSSASSGVTPGSASSGKSSPGRFTPPSIEELDVVLSSYEFIEILGHGGMGAVYKARQPKLDRLVAIKILPAELGEGGKQFAERFKREARALAQLNHPNIVEVYDFGQTRENQLYFVMEFVEGTDLHKVIRSGQATTEHVLGWIPQVCHALQYAHSKGIVHRDIKPANILIDKHGNVKVADFGLVKVADDGSPESQLTMTNVAMGTPDYVAPENYEPGVEPDYRADVYAIGVMLYEMLTGSVPRGAFKDPSQRVPGLDPRFDALVSQAMDADRDARIQQASEISTMLERIRTEPAASSAAHSPVDQGRQTPVASGRRPMTQQSPPSGAATPVSAAAISGPRSSGQRRTSAGQRKQSGPAAMVIGVLLAVLLVGGLMFFLLRDRGEDEVPVSEMLAESNSESASSSRSDPASSTGSEAAPSKSEPAVEVPAPPSGDSEDGTSASQASSPDADPKKNQDEEMPVAASPADSKPEVAVPETAAPAPLSEAAKKIAELFTKYETGYQNSILAEHKKDVEKLNASYIAALERERKKAASSGDLDNVVVFRTEASRLKERGELAGSDEGLPAALVRLRSTYRLQIESLIEQLRKKAAGLQQPFDRELALLEVNFTKEGKVDDALEIREARAKVKNEGLPFLASDQGAGSESSASGAVTGQASGPAKVSPEDVVRVSPGGGNGSLTLAEALAQAKPGQVLLLTGGTYPGGEQAAHYEIKTPDLTIIGDRASAYGLVINADRVRLYGLRLEFLTVGAPANLDVESGRSVHDVVVDSCIISHTMALVGLETSASVRNCLGSIGAGHGGTPTAVRRFEVSHCTIVSLYKNGDGMLPVRMRDGPVEVQDSIFFGVNHVFKDSSYDRALFRFADSFVWAASNPVLKDKSNDDLRANGYMGITEANLIDPGFVDTEQFPAGFRLKPDSPLRGKAKDGSDPGAKLDEDGWPVFDRKALLGGIEVDVSAVLPPPTPTAAPTGTAALPDNVIRVSPEGGNGSLTLADALAQAKRGQTLLLAEGIYPGGPMIDAHGKRSGFYEVGVEGVTLIGDRARVDRVVVSANRVSIQGLRLGLLVIGPAGYLSFKHDRSVNEVVIDSCIFDEHFAVLGLNTSATIVNSLGSYNQGDSNTRAAIKKLSFFNCTFVARVQNDPGMQPPRMGEDPIDARNCILYAPDHVFNGGSDSEELIRFTDSFAWSGSTLIKGQADNSSLEQNGYLGIEEEDLIEPGFEDPSDFPAGFQLKAGSPLRGKGQDGGDPGARLDEDGWPIFDRPEWMEQPATREASATGLASPVPSGRLRAYSEVKGGQGTLDISAAEGYDDFVSVSVWGGGGEPSWAAVRSNGEVISSDRALHGKRQTVLVLGRRGVLLRNGKLEVTGEARTKPVENVAHADGGVDAGLAVTKDGGLEVWGEAYEQPGITRPPDGLTGVVAAAQSWNMKGGQAIQAQAVLADGTVISWGMPMAKKSLPDKVPPLVQLDTGWQHFLGLTTEGEVLAWGSGSSALHVPDDLGKAIAIHAQCGISAAQMEDLSWVAWGDGAMGVRDRINAMGPALEIEFEANGRGWGHLVWIEPVAAP